MADNLTTLNTESLTAAVTSLLRKPLPDINVHISSATSQVPTIPVRQEFQPSTMPQQHQYIQQESLPGVLTVPQSEPPQQKTNPTLSYILNKPQQTSPNEPRSENANVPVDKNLKFSVDSLHLTSSSTETITQQPIVAERKSHSSLESPGNFQSALQNILNSYPLYNLANNTNNALENTQTPSNLGENSAQYTSSTQALQQLCQCLFPQSEPSVQPLPPALSAIYPSTSVSVNSCMTTVSSVSSEQNLGNMSYISAQQNIIPQRHPTQTLQDGNLTQVAQIAPSLTPNQLSQAPAIDLPNVIKSNTLQQFPFLVQPSAQGGPVQLIPIGPSLDLPLIQMLQKQNSKTSTASHHGESIVSTAVTIQPKTAIMNPPGLLSQTGAASSRSTPTILDLNLLQSILSSQQSQKMSDLHEALPPPVPYQEPDEIPRLPAPPTVLDTPCDQDMSAPHNIAQVSSSTQTANSGQSQCQSLDISTVTHNLGHATNTQMGEVTTNVHVQPHTGNVGTGSTYHVPPGDTAELPQEDHDETSHDLDEDQVTESGCHSDTGTGTTNAGSQQETIEQSTGIFCTVCYKLYAGGCKVHNTSYTYIEDTTILTRARASLPKCFYLQQTSITDLKDFVGIWCKEYVSERTLFGPLIGEKKMIQTSDHTQQTNGFMPYKLSTTEDQCEVLCLRDENQCNWMMFLRHARSLVEQNCIMYMDRDSFYIITRVDVKNDQELLMWFSPDLCQRLGISQDPENTKLIQCELCGQYFTSKKLQTSHLKTVHPDRYKHNWTCPMCAKQFSSNSKLNNHMMLHMGLKPYRCGYCTKQFSDASNLKTHILIHTGLKKYKCETCGKTFRQKAHLDVHYIVHTGTKKFKCTYCDKCFARQADLKTHTYRHTQEMSYTCQTCGKMFYKTQNYKKHLKVHTGERNYMCNKCFKGFQTKYHRDRHLKICKEKNGKESSYMSLEEVEQMGNTYEIPLKNVREGHSVEHTITDNTGEAS